jgi:hypothetical protein
LKAHAARATCRRSGPSIIGIGSYHFKYDSGREGDMPIAAFSPRKAATVLYGMGFSAAEPLLRKPGKRTTGKGCLYIKKLTDVDPRVLAALIVKCVAAARDRFATSGSRLISALTAIALPPL